MSIAYPRGMQKLKFPHRFYRRALVLAAALASVGSIMLASAFGGPLAFGVRCPVAATFGAPCPACGSTRSLRTLLAGDVASAFRVHPVAPFAVALALVTGARAVYLVARDGHAQALGRSASGRLLVRVWAAVLAAELVLWIARWFGLFGGPVPV